jgi:hypothetical protein
MTTGQMLELQMMPAAGLLLGLQLSMLLDAKQMGSIPRQTQ